MNSPVHSGIIPAHAPVVYPGISVIAEALRKDVLEVEAVSMRRDRAHVRASSRAMAELKGDAEKCSRTPKFSCTTA